MTTGYRLDVPWAFALTAAATTNVGAQLYVYENETTTLVDLFSDRDCSTPAANPIVSVNGYFPPRYIETPAAHTLTLKNTAGTTLLSADDITPYQDALQANAYNQAVDATLSALGALVTSADKYLRATGTDTFTLDSYATVLANIGAITSARTITAGAGLTGGGDLSANRTLAVDFASASEIRANTADQVIGTDEAWASIEPVALTDGATVAVDLSAGINFTLTIGGNRTLGQPSNAKVGQSGFIKITQDATGSRTLAYHADWQFAGGTAPVLSTASGTVDVLFYQVLSANFIYAALVKALS